MDRPGMFMDALQRGLPPPPASRTLGFELLSVDPLEGRIEVAFVGSEAFTNPYGEVLGGFLAAMLHDTVGPALLATLGPGEFIITRELRAEYLRPARVGRIVGRGRVLARVGNRVVLEGKLIDADGEVVATAEAIAEVVKRDMPVPRPLPPPDPGAIVG